MPDDPYISEAIIAAGPSAKVYRGYDRANGRRVRLKALLCQRTTGYDLDHPAVRELWSHVRELQHPQVTHWLTIDEHNDDMTIVSELPMGVNAWQFMRCRPLMPADLRAIASQLLIALHAGGVLALRHGDVKPSNIIMADHPAGGVVLQLQDWGLSECRHFQPRETLQFRALERLRGEPCTAPSDLFSVGATVAAMILGRAPVEATSPGDLHRAWAEFDPMCLRHARPDVDPAFHDWVQWLLRADPVLRPSSVAQALDVLASTASFSVPVQPFYPMPVWQDEVPPDTVLELVAVQPTAEMPVFEEPPEAVRLPPPPPAPTRRKKRSLLAVLFNLIAVLVMIGGVLVIGDRSEADWAVGARAFVMEHLREIGVVRNASPGATPITIDPSAPTTGGPNVRYVRVEIPGTSTLNLAEVQVFSAGENVATQGKASAKDATLDGDPRLANDGKTSGEGEHHSIYQSNDRSDDPWWELDLGRTLSVQEIIVWNRWDGGFASRLNNFSVIALDGDRREVWRTDQQSVPKPSKRYDLTIK